MTIKSILAFSTLLLTHSAYALECNTRSPEFLEKGDDYFIIEPIDKLQSSQQDTLDLINKILSRGKWTGTTTINECWGSASKPEVRTRKADIEAFELFENSNYGLAIRINQEFPGGSRAESVTMLGDMTVTAISTGERSVSAKEKYRTRTSAGGAVLVELNTSIQASNNRLSITILQFINSVTALERKIELYRRG